MAVLYSNEYLINMLKEFYTENRRVPGQKDFRKSSKYPDYGTYIGRFGSWEEALRLAGLTVNQVKHRNLSDDELLSILITFKEENGRVPVRDDFIGNYKYPSYRPYIKRFGSWNKALEAAGISFNQVKHVNRSDDELLSYLTLFYNENDKVPTSSDFVNNQEYPSKETYRNRFGSWCNALKLVNLDVDSLVLQGTSENRYQKGRKAEIVVINHFRKNPVDLSGENYLSPCDGICPDGMPYDVKSSSVSDKGNGAFHFGVRNRYKEKIEIYYLLGFSQNYENLLYSWRVPCAIVKNNYIRVSVSPSDAEYTTDNMREYDVTDKMVSVLKKKEE